MHSNPNHLYQLLYGGISEGEIRDQMRLFLHARKDRKAIISGRSGTAFKRKNRFDQYVRGFENMNGLRVRLAKVSGHLKKFAPEVDERYTNPEFETDWHDTLLDLAFLHLMVPPIPQPLDRAVVKSLVHGKAWA